MTNIFFLLTYKSDVYASWFDGERSLEIERLEFLRQWRIRNGLEANSGK